MLKFHPKLAELKTSLGIWLSLTMCVVYSMSFSIRRLPLYNSILVYEEDSSSDNIRRNVLEHDWGRNAFFLNSFEYEFSFGSYPISSVMRCRECNPWFYASLRTTGWGRFHQMWNPVGICEKLIVRFFLFPSVCLFHDVSSPSSVRITSFENTFR